MNLSAADPAYNLATVESHLVADDEPQERAAEIRERFEAAYTDTLRAGGSTKASGSGWASTGSRLAWTRWRLCRCGTRTEPEERDERERQHREAVAAYL